VNEPRPERSLVQALRDKGALAEADRLAEFYEKQDRERVARRRRRKAQRRSRRKNR
jgi:hypothetical protein